MPFSSLTLIRALESSNTSILPFLSPTPKRFNPINTSSPPPSPRLKAASPPSMFCIEAAKSSALPPIAFTA